MRFQTTPTTETTPPKSAVSGENEVNASGRQVQAEAAHVRSEAESPSTLHVETAIREWHQAQKERRRHEFTSALWGSILLLCSLGGCILSAGAYLLTAKICWFVGVGAGLMLLTTDLVTRVFKSSLSANVETIAEMEDARAIGPLLGVLEDTAEAEQQILCSILTRLLPHLQAEDAMRLLPSEWKALYSCVTMTRAERSPEFVTACLETVERAGNAEALPCLTLLVVQDAPTQAMQAVRARARQCLYTLTARLDFGAVQDIPVWVAKLPAPYGSNTPLKLARGVTWEECLTAVFALTRLLPQLTPADTGLLDKEARQLLGASGQASYHALTHGGMKILPGGVVMTRLGMDYDLARLAAFEQIGTGSDLPFLGSCGSHAVTVEDIQRIRAHVESVSAILKARGEKEEVGQTLLRGASAPQAPSGQLLRPAQATPDSTPPNELLRPDPKRTR